MPIYSMFRTEMRYYWLQLSSLTRILLSHYLPSTFHTVFVDHFDDFVTWNRILWWKTTQNRKIDHFTYSHVTEAPIKLYRLGLIIRLYNTSSGLAQCIKTVFKTKGLLLFEISTATKSGPNLDLGYILYYNIVKNAYIFRVSYLNEVLLAAILLFD